MNPKVGAIRYWACVSDETKRVEYDQWVLRSIQKRNGVLKGYWVKKVKGITWGKRSKKNGDFGFLKNFPDWLRESYRIGELPYSATKEGALRCCIATIRRHIKRFGDIKIFEDDELSLKDELDVALRAQKRLRAAGSK